MGTRSYACVVLALTLAVASSGCGRDWASTLRVAVSSQHNCPTRDVVTTHESGPTLARTVQVAACGTLYTYRDEDPRGAYRWVDVTSEQVASSDAPASRVERVRTASGTDWALRADITLQRYEVGLLSIPARSLDEVGLTLRMATAAGRDQCPVRALVGTQIVDLVPTRVITEEGRDRVLLSVTRDQFTAMASADPLAIRVCGEEITFDDDARAVMRELLDRIGQESVWQQ